MSLKPNEITDDEIRIISPRDPKPQKRGKRLLRIYLPVIAAVVLIGALTALLVGRHEADGDSDPAEVERQQPVAAQEHLAETQQPLAAKPQASTAVRDTTVNNKGLLILTPLNATPRLAIGAEQLNDTAIILATQAADIRKDNGQIAGTFVAEGELISKGEAKAGFCSIVNGELTIGIADATPMFEQALTQNGYFFRQYPLVVGGQIIENKPKGKAIRKALAEVDGRISVVVSRQALTFNDFSRLLADAGIRNAIYLVGSSSYGFYKNGDNHRTMLGFETVPVDENINYIIWQ